MKILMVSSDFPPDIGGIAAHVYELSKALVKRGHSVTVASVWLTNNPSSEIMSYPEGIEVHRINGFIHLGPFSMKARRYTLKRLVEQLVRTKTFDVVHIHGHTLEAYATKNISIPVVGTFHSNHFIEIMKDTYHRKKLSHALAHLSGATAPSTQLCELVNQLHLPAIGTSCVFISNGVDTSQFQTQTPQSASTMIWPFDNKKNKIILCARRIVEKNGILYLIQAMPKIIQQYPDALLVLAGSQEEPTYRKEIQEYIQNAHIEKYCLFLGSVPNRNMPNLMRHAAVSVLPSLAEATSITALESMAMGLPIVATTVGGLPEIIEHNKEGLLVPPRDASSLAEAIVKILSNSNLATALGQAALKRVKREFDWDIIAQRFEKVYQSVM